VESQYFLLPVVFHGTTDQKRLAAGTRVWPAFFEGSVAKTANRPFLKIQV
jgi:hypothetical protein